MAKQVRYLIDTNIWLERLLDQKRSREVGQFLDKFPSHLLHITDFSLHSIGVILCRLSRPTVYHAFVDDLFTHASVNISALAPRDMDPLLSAVKKHQFDFDDAYQYVCARKEGLQLVSFDRDFDKSDLNRREPAGLL